ncbi:MAG TPA: MFS transporter [Myxococcaceae bacterium]|nr:MFS transporter [Myxococcaceae bacterium]
MQPALPASRAESAAVGHLARARWGPVLALAGLHGAVSVAWVAYNLYLVELLVRAGFDAYLATVLVTVEGLLGAVLEPLMGALSDRARTGLFRRFFLVLGGVLVAALLFLALPLAAVGARPGPAALVPALLVAWSCAMAVFRAPALSLLGGYARPGALPLASSVLTAAAALVGAATPAARSWLLSLGALPTFAMASAALVLTALVVRGLDRRRPQDSARDEAPRPLGRSGARAAWVLFGVGTSSALAFRFLTSGLPRIGAGPGAPAAAITTAFFLGMAVTAIPVGRLALGRIGGGPVTIAGLCLLVGGAALLPLVQGAAAVLSVAAVLGAGLAAVQNGLFAWSLVAVRTERAGLGMGLLLGAGGLALGLFNLLLAVRRPAPGASLLAAAGLYALTGVLLAGLRRTVRATSAG